MKAIFKNLLSDAPAWHEKLTVIDSTTTGDKEIKNIPNMSGFRRSSIQMNNYFFSDKKS